MQSKTQIIFTHTRSLCVTVCFVSACREFFTEVETFKQEVTVRKDFSFTFKEQATGLPKFMHTFRKKGTNLSLGWYLKVQKLKGTLFTPKWYILVSKLNILVPFERVLVTVFSESLELTVESMNSLILRTKYE